MQRLTVIGYCGSDATVKDLGQNQVINFSVAVSETYLNKTTNEKVTNTTWYDVSKWGNSTALAQYIKKGTQVFVEGKPTARAWQKEDGTIVSVLGINAFEITLLGSPRAEGAAPAQQRVQQPHNSFADEPKGPTPEEDEDGLPF